MASMIWMETNRIAGLQRRAVANGIKLKATSAGTWTIVLFPEAPYREVVDLIGRFNFERHQL